MPASEVQREGIDNNARPLVRLLLRLQQASRSLTPLLPDMMPPIDADDADPWMDAIGEFPALTVGDVRRALSARDKIARVTDPKAGDPALETLTAEEGVALARLWPHVFPTSE